MSRTRIVILQMKELIYTAIFVGLGIILLILLFIMFWPGKGGKRNLLLYQAMQNRYIKQAFIQRKLKSGMLL